MKRTSSSHYLGVGIGKLYLASALLHIIVLAGVLRFAPTQSVALNVPIQVQLAAIRKEGTVSRKPISSVPEVPQPEFQTLKGKSRIEKPITPTKRMKYSKPLRQWESKILRNDKIIRPQIETPRRKMNSPSETIKSLARRKLSPFQQVPSLKEVKPPLPKTTKNSSEVPAAIRPTPAKARTYPVVPHHITGPKAEEVVDAKTNLAKGQTLDERLLIILRRIHQAKRYPESARSMGVEGTATVIFRIAKDGGIGALQIQKSSGYSSLDQASIEAIRRAAPFPFVPRTLILPIDYRLTDD